jgi:hypothetical protein
MNEGDAMEKHIDLRGLAEAAIKRRGVEEQHAHYQLKRRWGATREEPTPATVLRAEATLLALVSIAESLARTEARDA